MSRTSGFMVGRTAPPGTVPAGPDGEPVEPASKPTGDAAGPGESTSAAAAPGESTSAAAAPGESTSDEALARASAVGDQDAFEVIVRRHGPSMYRYARRMVRDPGDAEEVVQDAFVAAWRGLERFAGRSSLRTWLFSLTAHKATDFARRRRPEPARLPEDVPDATTGGDPAARAVDGALVDALERALLQLPERQRACWLLTHLDGLSGPETAQALELSPGAVRGQLARARENLREALAAWR